MGKKRLVRRAAQVGLVVLAVATVVMLLTEAMEESYRRRWRGAAEKRVESARQEYQAYLDETAPRLGGLPGDPRVVGEIQARHYRGLPDVWMYVWATAIDGQTAFGVPADAFARLSAVFDQQRDVIRLDNHYTDRDHFFRTLLHHPQRLTLEDPNAKEKDDRHGDDDWWRFHDEHRSHDHDNARRLFLSSPIQDSTGKTVGNLNLKLLDLRDDNSWRLPSVVRHVQGLSHVFLPFSLVWLWFLLPSWVYIDATERGVRRPVLWAALVLVGHIFALLVYLISRPGPATTELQCPRCGKALNGAKAGCPHCGADLSSAFCVQCQYPLKAEWTHCPACRTPITPTADSPSAEAK